MERFTWKRLNKQQVGAYAEYFVKMELTMCGFQVYTTEVDDRGIDFIARHESGPFIEVQVKSIRESGYVFTPKNKFKLDKNLYLALAILREAEEPILFLIPSIAWNNPNGILVSHDYKALKSEPEWGLNLSNKNIPLLKEKYSFYTVVTKIINQKV